MAEKYPKVSVIILNWNGKDDTLECIASLSHITYPNYAIVVVDNGSSDGSAAAIRDRFPGLAVLENEKNLGYAGGNNVGIEYVINTYQSDYVLILNNDTIVDPLFLDELVAVAETSEGIGIVGPMVYYYGNAKLKFLFWAAYCHVSQYGKHNPERRQFSRNQLLVE